MTSANSPDCNANTELTQGSIYTVVDDTVAVGACTDTNADGRVDGGGSFRSTCKCNASGSPAPL